MSKNKPYQGHRSWNAWNVSLWINNDEGLYRLALACIKDAKNRSEAAQAMLYLLGVNQDAKTPDGAPYSVTTVRAAMVGMTS